MMSILYTQIKHESKGWPTTCHCASIDDMDITYSDYEIDQPQPILCVLLKYPFDQLWVSFSLKCNQSKKMSWSIIPRTSAVTFDATQVWELHQASLSLSACAAPFLEQDGSCFYLSTELVGWEAAKTGCENIGGHLAMIKTAEQQQRVVNFLSCYSKKYHDALLMIIDLGMYI